MLLKCQNPRSSNVMRMTAGTARPPAQEANDVSCLHGDTGFGDRRRHLDGRHLSAGREQDTQPEKQAQGVTMEHLKEHLDMNTPPIVSPQEWEAARQRLLVKEKELTRARDALAAERRRMPWLAVEKAYEF